MLITALISSTVWAHRNTLSTGQGWLSTGQGWPAFKWLVLPHCMALCPGPGPVLWQVADLQEGHLQRPFTSGARLPLLSSTQHHRDKRHTQPYLRRQGKCTGLLKGPRSGTQNLNTEIHWRGGNGESGIHLISLAKWKMPPLQIHVDCPWLKHIQ